MVLDNANDTLLVAVELLSIAEHEYTPSLSILTLSIVKLDDLEHVTAESNVENDNTIWPLLVLKVSLVLYVTLSTVHMSVARLVTDDTLQVKVVLSPENKSDGGWLTATLDETEPRVAQSEEKI